MGREEGGRNQAGASWLTFLYKVGEWVVGRGMMETMVPGSPVYSKTCIKGLEVE